MEVGDTLISIDILIREVESWYDDYKFYACSVKGMTGSLLSFPFINSKGILDGYLIYHDNLNTYSEDQLNKLGRKSIFCPSPSGIVGGLSPLPYKPVSEYKIEELIVKIITANAIVDFTKPLSLPH